MTVPRWPWSGHGLRSRTRSLLRGPEIPPSRVRRYVARMRDVPRPALYEESRSTLAVVVPCYGHAAYVPTMFDSLARQTRPPDEVMFIVDGSRDDTASILARLVNGASEPLKLRCRLIENDRNLGQAASLNRAIDLTASDLVMVLNDDDYLMHDAIETALVLLGRHRDLALIGGGSIHFCGDAELEAASKTIGHRTGGTIPVLTVSHPDDVLGYRRYTDLNMTHSGSCFLRSAWAAVGGYEPEIRKRLVPFTDRDFQLRVNALFPVGVSYEVPFVFWRADSSVDHGVNS